MGWVMVMGIIGYALEVLGLVWAGLGLRKTWASRPKGEARTGGAHLRGSAAVAARSDVDGPLVPEPTTSERIAALEEVATTSEQRCQALVDAEAAVRQEAVDKVDRSDRRPREAGH